MGRWALFSLPFAPLPSSASSCPSRGCPSSSLRRSLSTAASAPCAVPLRTFCRPHVRGRLPCRPGTLHAGVVLNFRAVPRVRLVTRGQSHGVCHGVSGFACASGTALIGVRSPGHRLRIWPCFASTSPAPLPWTLLHLARHSDYLQAFFFFFFKESAGIVCASLPAVTFPAFVQLASVLLGKLLHPLRCGRPFLPAYERAALS